MRSVKLGEARPDQWPTQAGRKAEPTKALQNVISSTKAPRKPLKPSSTIPILPIN